MHITLREILEFELFEPFRGAPHKLQRLLNDSQILQYQEGEIIINEGDDDGALYVICQGCVVIAKIINKSTGRAKPLATLRKADYFGEMSLFDRQPRSATVMALENSYLLKISADAFQTLVQSDVEISSAVLFKIIQGISGRLRRTNMELVVLYDTGKFISRIKDFRKMCKALLERLSDSLDANAGLLSIYNELSGNFDIVAQLNSDELPHQIIVDHMKGIGKGFMSPGPESSNSIQGELQNQSLIAVPLVQKEQIYGSLLLFKNSTDKQECTFSDADFNLAMSVSQQASSAVENTKHRQDEEARAAYTRRRR
tara:strand:+ start:417 stop:1355 length:939 start_codon:yes stop_codon:yes gene_type:complete